MFAVIWAWINFTWFASAYDTDDWVFRVVTMVQLIGVLILAMGIEPMFHSLVEGDHVDNAVIVGGYVIMRLALVFQWLRAARQDPARRQTCLRYATYLGVVQLGWIAVLRHPSGRPDHLHHDGAPVHTGNGHAVRGRTFHADPLARAPHRGTLRPAGNHRPRRMPDRRDRNLRAIVANHGWSVDAALVGFGGTALAFAMWWIYFILPAGRALHLQRHRSFFFGYGHIPIFAAIAATGAGLHVAAYYIDHEAHISAAVAVASIAVPWPFSRRP